MKLFFAVLFFVSLAVGAIPCHAQQTIRLSVARSVEDEIVSKIQAAFTKETGIKLQFLKIGRASLSAYFKDLIDGKTDVAIAATSYDDWLKTMKDENIEVPASIQFTSRVVGRDTMYILTHKSANVTSLTLDQVADVFSGKVKNWREVGGADLPVKIFLAGDKLSSRNSFSKLILKHRSYSTDAAEVAHFEDMIPKIDVTPGGVVYSPVKPTLPNTVVVQTPVIGRPVTLISRGRPSPEVEKFINFMRKSSDSLKNEN